MALARSNSSARIGIEVPKEAGITAKFSRKDIKNMKAQFEIPRFSYLAIMAGAFMVGIVAAILIMPSPALSATGQLEVTQRNGPSNQGRLDIWYECKTTNVLEKNWDCAIQYQKLYGKKSRGKTAIHYMRCVKMLDTYKDISTPSGADWKLVFRHKKAGNKTGCNSIGAGSSDYLRYRCYNNSINHFIYDINFSCSD